MPGIISVLGLSRVSTLWLNAGGAPTLLAMEWPDMVISIAIAAIVVGILIYLAIVIRTGKQEQMRVLSQIRMSLEGRQEASKTSPPTPVSETGLPSELMTVTIVDGEGRSHTRDVATVVKAVFESMVSLKSRIKKLEDRVHQLESDHGLSAPPQGQVKGTDIEKEPITVHQEPSAEKEAAAPQKEVEAQPFEMTPALAAEMKEIRDNKVQWFKKEADHLWTSSLEEYLKHKVDGQATENLLVCLGQMKEIVNCESSKLANLRMTEGSDGKLKAASLELRKLQETLRPALPSLTVQTPEEFLETGQDGVGPKTEQGLRTAYGKKLDELASEELDAYKQKVGEFLQNPEKQEPAKVRDARESFNQHVITILGRIAEIQENSLQQSSGQVSQDCREWAAVRTKVAAAAGFQEYEYEDGAAFDDQRCQVAMGEIGHVKLPPAERAGNRLGKIARTYVSGCTFRGKPVAPALVSRYAW